MRRLLLTVSAFVLVAQPANGAAPPPPREGAAYAVPLYGTLVRLYDAPDDPYAPGHRGIDVATASGSPVYASAAGTVSFAGVVAGNRTVTIDHPDGVRTTYSYLSATSVKKNAAVAQGALIGLSGDGQPGSGLPPSVHLSARHGDVYFDPLGLYLGTSHADLLSLVS